MKPDCEFVLQAAWEAMNEKISLDKDLLPVAREELLAR